MTFEEYVRAHGPALVRLARLLDMYVRRMLVNANASWWRRRSSRELVTNEQPDRPVPADADTAAVERDALWRHIVALPPKQRATLVLRYYEDLDDVAIGEILECAPVTVRTHAMRALDTLRARLGDESRALTSDTYQPYGGGGTR